MMTDMIAVETTVAEEITIVMIDVIVTETAIAGEIKIVIIISLVVMNHTPILAHQVEVSKRDIMIEMTTSVGTEIIVDKLIKRETILQEEIDPHIIQMMLLTGLSNTNSTTA